jgi:hypothetical protein
VKLVERGIDLHEAMLVRSGLQKWGSVRRLGCQVPVIRTAMALKHCPSVVTPRLPPWIRASGRCSSPTQG